MDSEDFLELVYGDREGWIDLPAKVGPYWVPYHLEWEGEATTAVSRRIDSCLRDEESLYFSVTMFREKGRDYDDAMGTHWLWADLDEVNPAVAGRHGILPTVAWSSSPGRYQALWALDSRLSPKALEKVNRALLLRCSGLIPTSSTRRATYGTLYGVPILMRYDCPPGKAYLVDLYLLEPELSSEYPQTLWSKESDPLASGRSSVYWPRQGGEKTTSTPPSGTAPGTSGLASEPENAGCDERSERPSTTSAVGSLQETASRVDADTTRILERWERERQERLMGRKATPEDE
jgi:hypothetical protein